MKYTLKQLQVFLAVAHSDNISRAAEALSMSQSAVSGALRDLENQFSIQLFDRIGKRLKINELGKSIRPKAEALLERAKSVEAEFEQHQTVGQLRIGATLTIGNYLAVELMTRYMEDQPHGKLDLQVANTMTITQRVINFDLDIGLVEGEVQDSELNVYPWQADELVVFCHPTSPLAQLGQLTDAELLQAQWILREKGSGTRQTFDRAMTGILGRLQVLLELEQIEAIKGAVAAGLGLGCLPRIALQQDFAAGRLVELNIGQRDLTRRLYVLVQRHKFISAGMARWMRLCKISGY